MKRKTTLLIISLFLATPFFTFITIPTKVRGQEAEATLIIGTLANYINFDPIHGSGGISSETRARDLACGARRWPPMPPGRRGNELPPRAATAGRWQLLRHASARKEPDWIRNSELGIRSSFSCCCPALQTPHRRAGSKPRPSRRSKRARLFRPVCQPLINSTIDPTPPRWC